MRVAKAVVPMMVRIDPDVRAWIKDESQRLDRSQNWLINSLLAQARKAADQQQGAQR